MQGYTWWRALLILIKKEITLSKGEIETGASTRQIPTIDAIAQEIPCYPILFNKANLTEEIPRSQCCSVGVCCSLQTLGKV